jgi:predicted metalloprotease with PDZ domain
LPTVRYAVFVDPAAHCFRVVCELESWAGDPVFRLPNWIRGSYLVRDFAKHVIGIAARRGDAQVDVERIDKRSFRVKAPPGALRLEWQVYAYDASVRKAYLDLRRGFFNGSSLFYCPQGFEDARFEVELRRPDAWGCAGWRVATALSPVKVDAYGFGVYAAQGYEDLIDHPVEMAAFQRVDFDVDGIPHSIVLSGRCETDTARLVHDVTKVCHAQRELFGQEPKLDRYLFLTHVTSNGYGGLEHRASTALVTSRDSLPRPGETKLRKGYRGFLGLVSHEYFHLWNVKRITARAFAESDLATEAYTRDLWAYEGVTSYYDDLMLLRAGILDAPAYLDMIAEIATRFQRTPGRHVQSLAESSFEAWIKYYQPDENSPNQTISYYVKGALAALCLDLRLRRDSLVSFDDVMRALWTRYGALGEPVPEGGFERIASELSGLDLRSFFDMLLRSTQDLPLTELLADFGVQAVLRPTTGAGDEGGRADTKTPPPVTLGLALRPGDTAVAHVYADSAAAKAGLAGGDQLIAVDNLRVSAGNWTRFLETLTPGREVTVHFFRGDELLTAALTPAVAPADTWTFTLMDVGNNDVLARRHAWLGE